MKGFARSYRLVGCFGFNGSLRQCFCLFVYTDTEQSPSEREQK